MTTKLRKSRAADEYLSLIREFPLRPIRNDVQHDQAMAMIRRLAICDEGTLSPGAQDYLDTLTVLLEDFDRLQKPWNRISGLELLQHLIANTGMNITELGKIIGSRTLASLILSGKREISKDVMHRLGAHFHLHPGAFL